MTILDLLSSDYKELNSSSEQHKVPASLKSTVLSRFCCLQRVYVLLGTIGECKLSHFS